MKNILQWKCDKVGGSVFLGTFYHNLDAKNRLTIPSRILSQLSNNKSIIVSKGLDGCLDLRTLDAFDQYSNQLLALSQNKQNTRTILRQLLANASEIEIDSANRILLPTNLLDEAHISKEVVIIGVGNKCEIWDKEAYEKFKQETDQILVEIAEGLNDA